MSKNLAVSSTLATCYLLLATSPAIAHPLDVAYLDFSAASSGVVLTVALHPYQAFELVRGGSNARFDLEKLRANGDLVAAYAEEHVSVSQDGTTCDWSPGAALTPPTELEAVADGVTIAGTLSCPTLPSQLTVASTLFAEGFPGQTSVLRLELPDGFADRATLTRGQREATIDVTPLFTSSMTEKTTEPRVGDTRMARLLSRLLDPGLGIFGFLVLLFSAACIGALHALGPGHGKSLMAAMLVGEQATYGKLFALGTVMTATHVADVFVLSLLAGAISVVMPPTQLLQYLSLASAVGLVLLGFMNVWRSVVRYRLVRHNAEVGDVDDAHRRAHELGLPHTHEPSHEPHGHHHHFPTANPQSRHYDRDPDLTSGPPIPAFRHTLWTGFVGSLAPCPTAWALFLATLSIGRPAAGLALLIAFTVGLHLTVLTVGVLILKSKAFALRRTPARLTYALPILSACLIMSLGVILLIRLF